MEITLRSRLTLLAALVAIGSGLVYGGVNRWTSHGPEGGFVERPVIDPQNPNTIYVRGRGTLFKSTDAAAHWAPLSPAQYPATLVAVDPRNSSILYAETLALECEDVA